MENMAIGEAHTTKSQQNKHVSLTKGWEPTFLIRGFRLSGKSLICYAFVFYDLGLQSQNLFFLNTLFCLLFPDFRFVHGILTTHFTT